jgi:hypothetical protein
VSSCHLLRPFHPHARLVAVRELDLGFTIPPLARRILSTMIDNHDDRNLSGAIRYLSLLRRFRHIDWDMVILAMLVAIVVVVPTAVAIWRYLS